MSYWSTSSITEDEESVPEAMTESSSSTSNEDEDSLPDELLPSTRHSLSSAQRSIFPSYWNPPRCSTDCSGCDEEEDKTIRTLTALRLPIVDAKKEKRPATVTAETKSTWRPTSYKSFVDASTTHHPTNDPPIPARRQILPAPPRQQPNSSSFLIPQRRRLLAAINSTKAPVRKWRSASDLQGRSCLRKSGRYAPPQLDDSQWRRRKSMSCVDLHRPDAPPARSVSFHGRVDVFVFVLPGERPARNKGWRSYFA